MLELKQLYPQKLTPLSEQFDLGHWILSPGYSAKSISELLIIDYRLASTLVNI